MSSNGNNNNDRLADNDLIDLAGMSDTDDSDEVNKAEATTETSRSDRRKREHDSDNENEDIQIGMKIHKLFEDGAYYGGKIVSGPDWVKGSAEQVWRVHYEADDDKEDLTAEEIRPWIINCDTNTVVSKDDSSKQQTKKPKAKKRNKTAEYEKAKTDLCYKMGVTEDEVVAALNQMEPPYGLNKAMQLIHKAKEDPEMYEEKKEKFSPKIGLRIRKNFMGSTYNGKVIQNARTLVVDGDRVQMWGVKFDNGVYEDMDFNELMMYHADRPTRTHPVRGRQLCALELFSGCGMLTQEFAIRKWRVRSFDISETSYATDVLDIMKMRYEDLGMVPDFIWASPPCVTYSLMAAGTHRCPAQGQYEKTPKAHEHNRLFVQMVYIMRWAKRLNPHLIVVIENPAALLKEMPLLQNFVAEFGLHRTKVDYCAFGRPDKKPTDLWTNDFKLRNTLSQFKCDEKCPYFIKGRIHPVGARQHGRFYQSAEIPVALAEEVADHVHSTFYDGGIRYTKKVTLTEKDKGEFNSVLASK